MTRRSQPLATLLLLAAVWCGPAWPEVGAPSTGLRPLTPAERRDFERLVEETSALRGLTAPESLRVAVGERQTLRTHDTTEIGPQADLVWRAFLVFGFLPPEFDLPAGLAAALQQAIGGYYDPAAAGSDDREAAPEIVLVEGEDLEHEAWTDPGLHPRLQFTAVHEIAHAMQDLHFDLADPTEDGPPFFSDRLLAWRALAEGDASVVGLSHLLGFAIERNPYLEEMAPALEREYALASRHPDSLGADELSRLPSFLHRTLTFPYAYGLYFASRVRRAGGQKLLDHAFRADPPSSSEQILHPEKWYGERDEPIDVALPHLEDLLSGYRLALEGTLGEHGVWAGLEHRLGARSRRWADRAAAGWGGDRFALYTRDEQSVLVWLTEWDGVDEAREFHVAASEAFPGWRVGYWQGTRVVVIGGDAAEATARACATRLLAAPVTRPGPRRIDFAALAISEEDKAVPLSFGEAQRLMEASWASSPLSIKEAFHRRLLADARDRPAPTGWYDGEVFRVGSLDLRLELSARRGWGARDLEDWRWRIPFLVGFLSGAPGEILIQALALPEDVDLRDGLEALATEPTGPPGLLPEDRGDDGGREVEGEFVVAGKRAGPLLRVRWRAYRAGGYLVLLRVIASEKGWETSGQELVTILDSAASGPGGDPERAAVPE